MKRKMHETRRLVIRPYRISDFATWHSAYVDRLPAQNAWDRGPMPAEECTKDDYRALVQRHEMLAREDQVYIYGIYTKDTTTLVGAIDIAVLCRQDRQWGNLGYQLHNRYWGNGYAQEAVPEAFRIAFLDLKLHRLEAAVNLRNTRSVELSRKIGMTYEGIKRNYLFENGAWVDHHLFTITPEEIGIEVK